MAELIGMKEICDFMKRSEATMLDLIRNAEFPAVRINGGMWTADTDLIPQWRQNQIRKGMGLNMCDDMGENTGSNKKPVKPKKPQRSRKKPQRSRKKPQ